jgi:hypothetical protein
MISRCVLPAVVVTLEVRGSPSTFSNSTSSVSDAPLVSMVNLRDEVGLIA